MRTRQEALHMQRPAPAPSRPGTFAPQHATRRIPLTCHNAQQQIDDRHGAVRQLCGVLELLAVRHVGQVPVPVDLAGGSEHGAGECIVSARRDDASIPVSISIPASTSHEVQGWPRKPPDRPPGLRMQRSS